MSFIKSVTLKQWSVLAFVFLVSVFLYSSWNASHKVFTLDETDVALRAHLMNVEGYNAGGLVSGGPEALTHPPLYEWIVSILFRVFGETFFVLRCFGWLMFILSVFLSAKLLNQVIDRKIEPTRPYALMILIALLISNPLLIQHSMLVDADTALNGVWILCFLLIYQASGLWESGKGYWTSRLGLSVVFSLMLLSKEMTPYLILSACLFYRILRKEYAKFFVELILIGMAGTFVFYLIWGTYSTWIGMDPMRIWDSQNEFRYSQLQKLTFLINVLKRVDVIARWPVYWNSAGLIALALVAFAVRGYRFTKREFIQKSDLLWLVGLIIWIPFFFVKPSIDMMKYQYPVYFPIIVFIVSELYAVCQRKNFRNDAPVEHDKEYKKLFVVSVGFFAVMTTLYYTQGDYILILWKAQSDALWEKFQTIYWFCFFGFSVIWMIVFSRLMQSRRLQIMVSFCIVSTFAANTSLNIHQANADYVTVESWMNYGESGHLPTALHLKDQYKPNQIGCYRKDIRYLLEYLEGSGPKKSIDPRDIYRSGDLKGLETFILSGAMPFVVTDAISLLHIPTPQLNRVHRLVTKYYRFDRSFGSFKVFVLDEKILSKRLKT